MRQQAHTLTLRYLLTFSLCIIIPVIVLVIGLNRVYLRSQREMTRIQMQETVDKVSDAIGNEVGTLKILSSALSHNSTFTDYIKEYRTVNDAHNSYIAKDKIDLELSRLFLYTNKVGLITIFLEDRPAIMFRNSPLYRNLTEAPKLHSEVIEDIYRHEGRLHLDDDFYSVFPDSQQVFNQGIEPHLSLAIKPTGDAAVIDKIFFSYPVEQLSSVAESSSMMRFSFIVNESDEVILQPRNHNFSKVLMNNIKKGKLDEKRWIVLNSEIPETEWTLYQAIDVDEFTKPLYALQSAFFVIIGLLIVLFVLFTRLFFSSLIIPVNSLIDSMSLVEDGDYTIHAPEPKAKEMKNLIHSFNRMVQKIKSLTEKNTLNEKEKSRLEIQALQYQINPHFIANTLNSIRLMAVVRKNENIKNMTASLMQVVNDSFRSTGSLTTLRNEKALLNSYLHIMEVRFSNPIELLFLIDKDIEDSLILKMLLQPIVENSVVHGFTDKRSKGVILIKALRSGDSLLLEVIDNGVGMDSEHYMKTGMGSSLTKVGINNVDRRIKLNYGDNYGISIKSKIGFYTKVSILLPFLEEAYD